ncbi:Mg2+ transporter like zinc transport [Fusarium sp. NRRL 52700]|nr:Mg2+ transporter like zinc transport [Fusarium sp. NRRL 52700]
MEQPRAIQFVEHGCSRSCFCSIGEDGVTALIGSSGNLFQITRFFPDRNDKTPFCVDANSMIEPYFVTNRAKELYSRVTDPYSQGFFQPTWDPVLAVSDFQAPTFVNDRWPCFVWESADGVTGKTKYIISEDTIFQTWEFDFSRTQQPVVLPTVAVPRDLLIRNLDFVSCENKFNEPSADYFSRLSGDGSMSRGRCIDAENDICLFIAAFSNGNRVEFVERDKDTYQLSWSVEAVDMFTKDKTFEITIAYLLDVAPSTGFNCIRISRDNSKDATRRLQPSNTKDHSFTGDRDVDARLRRNLGHILSVCGIPVTPPKSGEIRAVALTCGDLDGHRVATAASFYCFQFLILALKHFNSLHPNDCNCDSASNQPSDLPYVCHMRSRIQNVCQGHLKWLFERTARPQGFFAPHYWVSGEEINWEKNEYLREKSLVDTPLHIIKAGEFFKSWLEDLDKVNKMGVYAFPHNNKGPYQKFHLTDHALIWRAIKSAEEMGFQSQLQVPSGDDTVSQTEQAERNHRNNPRMYSSSLLQQNLLKRFTVKNPISKQRMLALSRSPAHNRFRLRAKDTPLFQAMHLGLFDRPSGAGEMNDNGEPVMFDNELMRDTYWSITFEIPYVLWAYYPQPGLTTRTTMEPSPEFKREAFIGSKNEMAAVSGAEVLAALKQVIEQRTTADSKWATGSFRYVKHTLPFNNVVFEENIVEISDEWLYNKPAFFTKPINNDKHRSVERRSDGTEVVQATNDHTYGVVIDVPKGKQAQKKAAKTPVSKRSDKESIDDLMKQGRTPENAKKRFWRFSSAAPSANQIILHTWPSNYSTSPQPYTAENALLEFLDRHMKHANSFFEQTSLVLNIWSTEFHLSSYALVSKEQGDQDRTAVCLVAPYRKENGNSIVRTSLSFHFEGDLFDRYWTCRYLEADQRMPKERQMKEFAEDLLTHNKSLGGFDDIKAPWKQRRVLELILFDLITHKAQKQASEIVAKAKARYQELHHKSSTSTQYEAIGGHYREFSSTRKQYQQVQTALQLVEEDITQNLAVIDLWRNREKERQAERPRWTFNDESRYRRFIVKMLASNSHRIRELTSTRSEIRDFIDTLSKSLEDIRNDLDQRRADHIQRFTHVTVIFLPLGFATGVFSMSQAPEGCTLAFMLITAVAAVIATIVLLLKAEYIESLWKRSNVIVRIGLQNIDRADNAKKEEGRSVALERYLRLSVLDTAKTLKDHLDLSTELEDEAIIALNKDGIWKNNLSKKIYSLADNLSFFEPHDPLTVTNNLARNKTVGGLTLIPSISAKRLSVTIEPPESIGINRNARVCRDRPVLYWVRHLKHAPFDDQL